MTCKRWLNDWIMNYVDGDPSHLVRKHEIFGGRWRTAEVVVEEVEGNPWLLHVEVLPDDRTTSLKA
jgi:predicted component of type VI protein secretion system